MAIVYVDLEDVYTVKSANSDISISVVIGDGQSGGYTIFLAQQLKGTNKPAHLGIKADVIDKKATVTTTVVDVLDETNWTSMTVMIDEGDGRTVYGPYKKLVPNHQDSAIYALQIHFQ